MAMTRMATALSLLAAITLASQSVYAQPEAVPEGPATEDAASPEVPAPAPKPWNAGISTAQKEAAQPFFEAGNEHFERSSFGNALKEYRQAITFRDHPAIRYNMAICLINLDQPIEAYEQLESALQFGEAPLGKALFKEGQTYRKLLLGQLAELLVATEEVGAKVSLDGEELFVGPGESRRLVQPKRHQLIATKDKMLTLTRELVPAAGELNRVDLELVPIADGVVLKRRWASWKPWAVAGAGAGLALLGVPVRSASGSNADSYDSQVVRACPGGCTELPADIAALRSRAETQEIVAFSLFFTGGALLTAGVVAAFLNRPQPQTLEASSEFAIVPTASGDGMAASFGSTF